jgi:small GTP-binding protein
MSKKTKNNIANVVNQPVTVAAHLADVFNSAAFSPDGNTLASGSNDNTIKLWDVKNAKLIRSLEGHSDSVRSVVFSPDGNILASGSNDNTIKLWDVKNAKLIRSLEGHSNSVRSVVFSPDGNILASSSDRIIKLWDVKSAKLIRSLEGHNYSVQIVVFSPDGNILASGSYDHIIKLWDIKSAKLIGSLEGHSNSVRSVVFSPDGNILASGSYDNTIKLWDVNNAKLIRSLEGHNYSVQIVAFSPDGNILASGSNDNTIKLWDVKSAKLIRSLEGHSDSVQIVAFSPDGNILASGSNDNTIKLWDVKNAKLIRSLEGHSDSVLSVVFSPDGNILASSSYKTIKLWDVNNAKLIGSLEGHSDSVQIVVFSPDGNILASSSYKTIKLWDVKNAKLIGSLEGHSDSVLSVVFSPDGNILASSSDKTIKLWDVKNAKLIGSLEGHSNSAHIVVFSPDGNILASSSYKTIKLWDVKNAKLIRSLEGHSDSVRSVVFSPDGNILASGSNDDTIKLWDVNNAKLIRSLEGHNYSVQIVVFSPDGNILASGSNDNTIKLWDVKNAKLIGSLEGHSNSAHIVAFSPDGNILASGSNDNTIKLWDVKNAKLIRSLEGHNSWVNSVVFSLDGNTLASGSNDRTIKLWDTETWAELATYQKIPFSYSLLTTVFLPVQHIANYFGLTPPGEPDIIIHVPEPISENLSLKSIQLSYASAKIVLIGESNVGKSCLALRMAQNRYEEQGTTHGMQLWTMLPEQLSPDAITPKNEEREIVIWDLGGQDEYRLVHQLFLHDTNLALFLFDPTRGRTAFEDVQEWNLRLEKQLRGRQTIKFLVGTKLDQSDAMVDQEAIKRIVKECGFRDYYSTSAKAASGIKELGKAISEAIDWEGLSKTTRPEFFQRIREAISEHQQKGEVVLLYSKLEEQMRQQEPEQFNSDALNTVIGQLAGQGAIVETRLASGERILALQIGYIEMYAGSLILAARDNPRGIPAIEELALTQGKMKLPSIKVSERLDAIKERVMLECVVQILIEHGICLRHEGLLIFPAMFKPFEPDDEVKAAHTVSLYYDFSGAIDNIWSSLVVRLVLSEHFGRVRMWKDRVEYDNPEQGVCGLQKKDRKGGMAHLDLLFSQKASKATQDLFTTFVEDHLRKEGIKIKEVLEMDCPACSYRFEEALVKDRIDKGKDEIGCPQCDTRCLINKGAEKTRTDNPEVQREFFALKTVIEHRQQKEVREAKQSFAEQREVALQERSFDDTPIRILHLSDLHWGEDEEETSKTSVVPLIRDLKVLGIEQLNYIVISGDITNRATEKEFETAYLFLSEIISRFNLSAERCFIVPGNHDFSWEVEVYNWKPERKVTAKEATDKGYVKQGEGYLICDNAKYPERFKNFARFYKQFTQGDYALKPESQSLSSLFEDTRIQFLMLNSAWEIDEFNKNRSSINYNALQYGLDEAARKIDEAKATNRLANDAEVLRLAILHHPVTGNEKIINDAFLEHLRQEKVALCLHGHIHEDRADLISHTYKQKVYAIGAGSFGAIADHRPPSTPNLYNLLEVQRDHSSIRVHTRHKKQKDGAWEAWYNWDDPNGSGKLPYYDIILKPKS